MSLLKTFTGNCHPETAKSDDGYGEYDEGETYFDVPPPPPPPPPFPKDKFSLKSDETNDSKKSPLNILLAGDSMGNETLEIMRAANAVLGDNYDRDCPSVSYQNTITNDGDELNKREFQFTDINNEWNEDSFFKNPLLEQNNRNSQIVFEEEKSSQVEVNDSNTNQVFPIFDDREIHTDSGDTLNVDSIPEHADMMTSQDIPKCCSLISQHVDNAPSHDITPNQSSRSTNDISDYRFDQMLILDPHNRAETLKELDSEDKQELRNRLNYNECRWSISPRSVNSGCVSINQGKIDDELCENTTEIDATVNNKERLINSDSELVSIPQKKSNEDIVTIEINDDMKEGIENKEVLASVKNTKEQKSNVQNISHDASNECDENKNLKKKPFLKRGSRKEPSSLYRLNIHQHNKIDSNSQNPNSIQTKKERLQELEDIQQKHIQQLEERLKKRELTRKCLKQKQNKKLTHQHDDTNANRKEANVTIITKPANVGKITTERKMKGIPSQSKVVNVQNIHDSGSDEIWDSDAIDEQNFSPSLKYQSIQKNKENTIPERPKISSSKIKDSLSPKKPIKMETIKNKGPPELLKFNNSKIEEQWRLIKSMRKRQETALRAAEKERESVRSWATNERETVKKWVISQRELIQKDRQKAANTLMAIKRKCKREELENKASENPNLINELETKQVKELKELVRKLKIDIDAMRARQRLSEKSYKDTINEKDEKINTLSEEIKTLKNKVQKINQKHSLYQKKNKGTNTQPLKELITDQSENNLIDDVQSHNEDDENDCFEKKSDKMSERSSFETYSQNACSKDNKTDKDVLDRKSLKGNTITYSNGTKKEIFPDGSAVISFTNGDRKTVHKNGESIYFYAFTKTTHKTYPDGSEAFEFENGQKETHLANGQKNIIFSDGTKKVIFAQGGSSTEFPDGVKVIEYADGSKEIERL